MHNELEEKIKEWDSLPPTPNHLRYPPAILKLMEWRKPGNSLRAEFNGVYRDFVNSTNGQGEE